MSDVSGKSKDKKRSQISFISQALLVVNNLPNQAAHEWRTLMLQYQNGEKVLSGVLSEYAQPSRHYHTVQHIAEMTLFLAESRALLTDYPAALFACLYHDVVYDATKGDNEEQSIARWRADAARLGLAAEVTVLVANLILATKRHQPLGDSPDRQLFLDADLSILGSDPLRYEEYAAAFRREYAHVAVDAYREGRIAVLQKFLQRPRLYFTQLAHARFENRARENIASEIAMLMRAGAHGVG